MSRKIKESFPSELTEVYQAVMDMSSDAFLIAVNGNIIRTNPALRDIVKSDVTGLSLSEFFSIMFTELSSSTSDVIETTRTDFLTKNNEKIPVEIAIKKIQLNDQEVEIVKIRPTLTEIVAENAELCEKRYAQTFSFAPIAFITISPRGIIQDVNKATLDLLGYRTNRIRKRHISVLFPNDDRGKRDKEELLTEIFAGKFVREIEVRFRKADGTPTWVSVTAFPIRTNEMAKAFMILAVDINRRRVAEEKAAKEHERANLYLEVMTHDLNNINQELLFALGLLQEQVELPSEVESLIEQTYWNIRRSARMIRNMRTLLQLAEEPPTNKPIDLYDVVTSAIESVRKDLPWKKIELNHNLAPETFLVQGNTFLQDVFFNVFHNAALFTNSETVTIDMVVSSDGNEDNIHVNVEDYGPGIPDSLKEAVFRKTEADARKLAGKGLGLTLVYQIMQSVDGDVWIEDRVSGDSSKGTRVVLEFSLWREKVQLQCGRKKCITFYASEHCLFCKPSLEILKECMTELGISFWHMEIIDVDDPTVELHEIEPSMLPVVRICEEKFHGLFSKEQVKVALINLMLKPCFSESR